MRDPLKLLNTGIRMGASEQFMTLQFGSRKIEYSVHYSNRTTLGIIVRPDQSVKVRVPLKANSDKIEKIVRKKAPWIIRSIEYFEALLPKLPPKNYVSGESYYFLGRHYRLKVHKSNLEDVRLNKSNITVHTKHKSNSRVVQVLLNNWYRDRAEKKFKERLEFCFGSFKSYYSFLPKLSIRSMKTRWGSCNTKNKILLNQDLIKTPTRCIDYVIMHELCHLIYRNHDHQFYSLLTKLMPGWKERKTILERSVGKL